MHTFRFNPVFRQWVLLGSPVPVQVEVTAAQLLSIGKGNDLVAATYPKQPFILDPKPGVPKTPAGERLYADEPALGEYELFLYGGKHHFYDWKQKQWEAWLTLAQQRILQFHHNPHIHFAALSLHTSALDSVSGYQRVGDLIGTSHQIAGEMPLLTPTLADKLFAKERGYVLHESKQGRLQVPSAPLGEQEVWYVPTAYKRGIEQIGKSEREECAFVLAKLFPALHEEYPRDNYVLTVYTAMADHKEEITWWIRIQRQATHTTPVQSRPYPEGFLRTLRILLTTKRV
jgi:hypothetical protein